MQLRALLTLLLGLVFSKNSISQTITILPIERQYCGGTTASVPYQIVGIFNAGNSFSVQLSDQNGSFSTPTVLGASNSITSGNISALIPSGLLFGFQYKIRIVSTNPATVSLNTVAVVPENTDSDSWVRRRDFGGAPRAYSFAFSIGSKGYIGTGSSQSGATNDFWEYDSNSDTWTQKRSFGGFLRSTGVAFSIGSKGYGGTGNNNKDFWEYDPATDTWTQKADLPGAGRSSASGFSIGSKGYLGLGKNAIGLYNDFWAFDPTTNSWAAKSNFPGTSRDRAVGFSIENKGYIGLGNDGTQYKSDLWEYNPQNDTWISRAAYPGGPRMGSIAFSIGSKGYVGSGFFNSNKSDFYEFDPTSNAWTQKANTGGNARRYAVGFSIGNKGYISTGIDIGLKNDLWEYTAKDKMIHILPINKVLCPGSDFNVEIEIGCEAFSNGNIFTLQLSDSLGAFENPINIGTLASTTGGIINATMPTTTSVGGRYMIRVLSSSENVPSQSISIGVSRVTSLTLTSLPATENQEVCVNNPIGSINYTFFGGQSIVATGLPAGVTATINDSTFTISGTPTAVNSGGTAFQIDVNGGCIPVSITGTILVKPNTSIVTEPSNQDVQYCLGLASTPLDITSFGSDLTYQWYASGTPDFSGGIAIGGANSPTYLPSTTLAGKKYYYCVVYGGCGIPDTTILTGAHVVKSNGTWLGYNTSWFDSTNWCGAVPGASTDVLIPASVQYPSISGSSASCKNITIENGASVSLNNQTFNIFGNITSSGGFDASSGTINMAGNFRQPIDPISFVDKKISRLKISNPSGVELLGSDTLKIRNSLDFGASNCELFTNGKLVIMSDQIGTASVGDMTSDGSTTNVYNGNQIIGNVTVERYIPNHPKAWQFLSAPATGATIKNNWQEGNSNLSNSRQGYGSIITSDIVGATSPLLGFDLYTPAGSSMKTYNATTNAWEGISSTQNLIDNPKGYLIFIRGDRSVSAYNQSPTATTLRTTGKLYQAIGTPPPSISVARNKFASVGNPYASEVDMTKFVRTGGVQDLYYIWDPKLTSSAYSFYGYGMYRTLVRIGNGYRAIPAETGGTSYYDISNQDVKIQSGQAFFIHADSAIGDGALSFSESVKSVGNATVTRGNQSIAKIFINLFAVKPQEQILLDGTLLVMDSAYSNQVDFDDALKIANAATTERISIFNNEKQLTADLRSIPTQGDTAQLFFEGARKQSYRFQMLMEDCENMKLIPVLVDRFSGSEVELIQSVQDYEFSVNEDPASSSQMRFYVYFKRLQPVPVNYTSVSALRVGDKETKISWEVENEISIISYDVLRSKDGVHFEKIGNVIANDRRNYVFTDRQTPQSMTYYRIQSVEVFQSNKLSEIVKVNALSNYVPYVVNPNPVEGNKIRIEHSSKVKEWIKVNLYNAAGQCVFLHSIKTNPGQSYFECPIPVALSAGNYKLTLSSSDNESHTLSVFIK
jgi:hypothetical protein